MKKNICIVFLLCFFILNSAFARFKPDVWIELKGFDPVLEEMAYQYIEDEVDGFVNLKRDPGYGYDQGISYDGGISIAYLSNLPAPFSTRRIRGFNIDGDSITIMSAKIDKEILALYQGKNRINAFFNAILHEVVCHGLTQKTEHIVPTEKQKRKNRIPLCSANLSTHKKIWRNADKKYLRQNINVKYKSSDF